MAKYSRSITLLIAAALAIAPASLGATRKKPPVTTIKPAPKPAPKPSDDGDDDAGPAARTLAPAATPRPKVATPAELDQTLAQIGNGALPLAARGAIAIDFDTGATLYEKNPDAPQFPAGTTKIMTALLVIENGDLEHEVECDLDDSKVGESSLQLKPGQHYTRRQMLYGLMLKSANDVAHALARDNAGSIEAFAEKMNRRAAELGAKTTHFVNPNGLHDLVHYTTPRDLALIARAAMQQPLFREIVATRNYNWASDTGIVPLRNHNRLLERFAGCTGVKTGFTNPAQQVLVSAALRGRREVIAVVMHTDKPGIWDDSMLLLGYGFLHTPAALTAMESK